MMKINTVSFRENISQIMNKVKYEKKQYVITRSDRPMAAIISIKDFDDFMEYKKEINNETRDH
jgi:prevent-host-death family protein